MTIRKDLAEKIASELFEFGSKPNNPTSRIAFMSGPYPYGEKAQGGMCESSLARFIEEVLEQHSILVIKNNNED